MTSEEHIKLVAVGDRFWSSLGQLAAEHINMMPKDLERITVDYLQDKCSIYSTTYAKHLAYLRKK